MRKLLFFALCVCGLGDFAFSQEAKIFHFGDVEFVALKDKDTNMGKAILLTPDAPVVKKVMKDDQNPSSINAFLVKFKGQNALIDTGVGGELMSALKSVGVGANDVDIVLLTHMHGDHIAGLLDADKKRAFKKAKVFVHEKELSYWLNNQSAKKENADLVKAVKAAYGADLLTFKWDDYIELTEKCRQLCEAPQFRQPIKLINAEGHTPGHTAFEIDSGGEKILVVGDIVRRVEPYENNGKRVYEDTIEGVRFRVIVGDINGKNGAERTISFYSNRKPLKGAPSSGAITSTFSDEGIIPQNAKEAQELIQSAKNARGVLV